MTDVCMLVVTTGPKEGKILSIVDAKTVATQVKGAWVYGSVISSPRCSIIFVSDFPADYDRSIITGPLVVEGTKTTKQEYEYLHKLDLAKITAIQDKLKTISIADFKAALYNVKYKRTSTGVEISG